MLLLRVEIREAAKTFYKLENVPEDPRVLDPSPRHLETCFELVEALAGAYGQVIH